MTGSPPALYEVVVDSVELGPCEVRAAEARAWLRLAVARPLRVSSVVALESLRRELDRVFDGAPDVLVDWLDEHAPVQPQQSNHPA